MLYHDIHQNVNQIFAMIIDKKINDTTYFVTSRNYFKLTDDFEVLAKCLMHIEKIKLISIKNENNLLINTVNQPMSKLVIQINKKLNLEPMDIIRIYK
jgi:hypothetical protein